MAKNPFQVSNTRQIRAQPNDPEAAQRRRELADFMKESAYAIGSDITFYPGTELCGSYISCHNRKDVLVGLVDPTRQEAEQTLMAWNFLDEIGAVCDGNAPSGILLNTTQRCQGLVGWVGSVPVIELEIAPSSDIKERRRSAAATKLYLESTFGAMVPCLDPESGSPLLGDPLGFGAFGRYYPGGERHGCCVVFGVGPKVVLVDPSSYNLARSIKEFNSLVASVESSQARAKRTDPFISGSFVRGIQHYET